MQQIGPLIGVILLFVISTVFSRKADQARKRAEEAKKANAPAPPTRTPRTGAARSPRPMDRPAPGDDLSAAAFEEIPFDEVDIIGDGDETRFTDDLANEMLHDNAHLAKQLGTLRRWNRRS